MLAKNGVEDRSGLGLAIGGVERVQPLCTCRRWKAEGPHSQRTIALLNFIRYPSNRGQIFNTNKADP